MPSFDKYRSPYSWRYGSEAMRRLWSEESKRRVWRDIWLSLAKAQADYGLVDPHQIALLEAHVADVVVERALEVEAVIQHDLMAELQVYAAQCEGAGGILHMGATSMDIKDNAEVLLSRRALQLLLDRMEPVLKRLAELILQYADTRVMAYTHLQPAEPTTFGYRLAQYGQDLLADWQDLNRLRDNLLAKGFKGAVGTGAAFAELIGREHLGEFERKVLVRLDLSAFPVTTQTYPRSQDYRLLSALAGVGASLYKFAFDLRVLQTPAVGEASEPFGKDQVGSSAMPFKRNPIQSEKIDSLARLLAQMPRVAWDNAAHSLLERTLDDSANRRTLIPEAFLITEELLLATGSILDGLLIRESAIQENLKRFGPFAGLERLLTALSGAGANRLEMHSRLRAHALQAWGALEGGRTPQLEQLVVGDPELLKFLTADDIRASLAVEAYVGDAPERARALAAAIQRQFG